MEFLLNDIIICCYDELNEIILCIFRLLDHHHLILMQQPKTVVSNQQTMW